MPLYNFFSEKISTNKSRKNLFKCFNDLLDISGCNVICTDLWDDNRIMHTCISGFFKGDIEYLEEIFEGHKVTIYWMDADSKETNFNFKSH